MNVYPHFTTVVDSWVMGTQIVLCGLAIGKSLLILVLCMARGYVGGLSSKHRPRMAEIVQANLEEGLLPTDVLYPNHGMSPMPTVVSGEPPLEMAATDF